MYIYIYVYIPSTYITLYSYVWGSIASDTANANSSQEYLWHLCNCTSGILCPVMSGLQSRPLRAQCFWAPSCGSQLGSCAMRKKSGPPVAHEALSFATPWYQEDMGHNLMLFISHSKDKWQWNQAQCSTHSRKPWLHVYSRRLKALFNPNCNWHKPSLLPLVRASVGKCGFRCLFWNKDMTLHMKWSFGLRQLLHNQFCLWQNINVCSRYSVDLEDQLLLSKSNKLQFPGSTALFRVSPSEIPSEIPSATSALAHVASSRLNQLIPDRQ